MGGVSCGWVGCPLGGWRAGIRGGPSSSAASLLSDLWVMALFMDSDLSLLKPNQHKDLMDFKVLFGEQDQCKGTFICSWLFNYTRHSENVFNMCCVSSQWRMWGAKVPLCHRSLCFCWKARGRERGPSLVGLNCPSWSRPSRWPLTRTSRWGNGWRHIHTCPRARYRSVTKQMSCFKTIWVFVLFFTLKKYSVF